MANMHFLASVYATQRGNSAPRGLFSSTNVPATQGVQMSFPSVGTIFYPIPVGSIPSNVFNGATTVNVIEVLPQGLNQPSLKYYVTDSISTLDTAAK